MGSEAPEIPRYDFQYETEPTNTVSRAAKGEFGQGGDTARTFSQIANIELGTYEVQARKEWRLPEISGKDRTRYKPENDKLRSGWNRFDVSQATPMSGSDKIFM